MPMTARTTAERRGDLLVVCGVEVGVEVKGDLDQDAVANEVGCKSLVIEGSTPVVSGLSERY